MTLWLTKRLCVLELRDRGFTVCQKTVSNHFMLLKSHQVNVRLKPSLTSEETVNRCTFILGKLDRGHGLNRPGHHYKNQKDTINIDESWFYLQTVDNRIRTLEGTVIPENQKFTHITLVRFT